MKYPIITQNATLSENNKPESLNNQKILLPGQIVKIDAILQCGTCVVQLLQENDIWDTVIYTCHRNLLTSVKAKLWQFLAAIASLEERIKLVSDKSRCEILLQITVGSIVVISVEKNMYVGTVKFIGNVKDIGKCFGIQLHEKLEDNSCDGFYGDVRYFQCTRGYGLFTTIDKLTIIHMYRLRKKNLSNFAGNYRAIDHTLHTSIDDIPVKKLKKTEPDASVETKCYEVEGNMMYNQSNLCDKYNTSFNGLRRSIKNKRSNSISHLINSTETLPTEPKLNSEKPLNNDIFVSTKNVAEEDNRIFNAHANNLLESLVKVKSKISKEPPCGAIRQIADCTYNSGPFIPLGQCQRYSRFSNGTLTKETFGDCQRHSRFSTGTPTPVNSLTKETFRMDCPIVPGCIAPITIPTEKGVKVICGPFKGIQGFRNSCYLDTTLFAMFTYTSVFDSLLHRPKNNDDIPLYEEVQRVLREEIVNPLRQHLFVKAERVMNLRMLLNQLSSGSGFTTNQKDPEEFLGSLLGEILKVKPFLKFNSGQEAYHYQLFVEKDYTLKLPTVQELFEESFLTSDVKLKEVPARLIIQMPRFGKRYKAYGRIQPSQLLDVTDVIEKKQCSRRLFMELFAVLCIKASHYVAFAKCGAGHEAPWCFFNSMSCITSDGCVPELEACPDVSKWLSDDKMWHQLHENCQHDKDLPVHARWLLCEAYICMYQSPETNATD